MTKYTSIVHTRGGQILSVRAHAGHMTAADTAAYIDGHNPPLPRGNQFRFDHVELYSDIGDSVYSITIPVR